MSISKTIFKVFNDYYYLVLQKLSHIKEATAHDAIVINQYLKNALEKQLEAIQTNYVGREQSLLKKCIYLSASLTDELFLETNWPGKESWKGMMLEHELFQTQNAGEHILRDIESIIARPQSVSKEMIEMYLIILSLGFKGGANSNEITILKENLLRLIQPSEEDFKELMPEVFRNTNDQISSRYLLDIRSWLFILGFIVVGYIIISSYFWHNIQKDIYQISKSLKIKVQNSRSLI